MRDEIFPKSYEFDDETKRRSEIDARADRFDEERIRKFMEHLVGRVEKLEAAETIKAESIENISQALNELRKNNITIWQRYDEKLYNIEKILDKKSVESSHEIDAMKLEFRTLRELYAGLKGCCDKNGIFSNGDEMEKRIEQAMAGYFGAGVSKQELNKIVESLIVASERSVKSNNDARQSSAVNGDDICTGKTSLSDDDMRKIVNEVLKIYDADKTGRVDYALESAGGQVISTRCTQRYNVNTRAFKLLGFTLFYESNNPRTVIQGNSLQPGLCWAFQDFPGYLLVKLRSFIRVTGFTVEHVPRAILPNREMRSAPRKFNVWGLKDENDVEPIMFGDYEFEDSEESLQYFPVQNPDITEPYEYVELRIHSNHGQLEYTCLYRFRVHGIPV